MRHITKYKRQRISERPTFDHFLQLWFNYHLVFFHYLMLRGLKLRAFNIFLKIKKELKYREDFDPSFVFLISMLTITPSLMIRTFERRGSIYQIPLPVTYWKKIILSCSWVVKLLKELDRTVKVDKVVEILSLALTYEGLAIDKKEQVYHIAEVNRHILRNRLFRK